MGSWDEEFSKQNAEAASRSLRFFLLFPFLFSAFATLFCFVVAALKIAIGDLIEGRSIQFDLFRGAQGMVPVFLLLVAATFVGEVGYFICRKWR